MPRHSTHRYTQRESDSGFIVSDDEIEGDVVEGRRRQPTQSQRGDGFSSLSEKQQDELKQRFIRFMLSRNARKRPVRRADLTKHLFNEMESVGSKQRVFTGTFDRAQTAFKTVYGMEIVELKRRPRRAPATQRGTMTMTASQSTGTINKAYILVSCLPEATRIEDEARTAEIGLLTVIAAMIILTPGCRIAEKTLYKELQRLGIYVKDMSGHKQINAGDVRELVEKEWPDQWYLDREKEDNDYFFSIGPRLFAEVDSQHLIEFIDAVYSISGDSAKALDETARRELRQRIENARKVFDDDGEEDN